MRMKSAQKTIETFDDEIKFGGDLFKQKPYKFLKFDRVNDKLIASLALKNSGHSVTQFNLDWKGI